MWQKIKCWLGWHEWHNACLICANKGTKYCRKCGYENSETFCKHCWKVNR